VRRAGFGFADFGDDFDEVFRDDGMDWKARWRPAMHMTTAKMGWQA
jgi:hypothetical protein